MSERRLPNGIKSRLALRDQRDFYKYKADYYRNRAITESLYKGVILDTEGEQGVPLVEGAASILPMVISGLNVKYDFAINSDGIATGRIVNDTFYPIDITKSEEYLRAASRYEQLSKSFLRRALMSPFYKKTQYLEQSKEGLDGIVLSLREINLGIHEIAASIKETAALLGEVKRF